MSLTTKERLYMKIILAANLAILASALLTGCLIPGGSCDTSYDGSEDCDPLVTSNDLEGTWCNQRSEQTCLTVDQSSYPQTRYMLQVGLCYERGTLTGGLEFNPDTSSRVCLPGFNHNVWSASGKFTAVGLKLADPSQCWHDSYCDGTAETMVWANDLDLSYVR